jgi:CoA:oxalate CoA-transferase
VTPRPPAAEGAALPLASLKVLDLSRVLAGPYCSMILADLGAAVIKVELPGTGDDSRAYGPFINGESAYFMSLNRNKKSLCLDLKRPEGRQVIEQLAEWADVLIENFRPGTMERLSLGYEQLARRNPGLIYAACSGFGHTGPYRDRPSYDIVAQAMGGLMSVTGQPDGPPTRCGVSVGDLVAGLFTAIGILTAVVERASSGRGQKVDVSMLDCQVSLLENAIARCFAAGPPPGPLGNHHPAITPFSSFCAADGHLVIAAGNDAAFRRLCGALDLATVAEDARFATNESRTAHRWELTVALEAKLATAGCAHWLGVLEAAEVACAPVLTVPEVVRHPQVLAREMIVETNHPVAGAVRMPGVPVKLSRTPGAVRSPAPVLGQHTEEILTATLGYTAGEVEDLRRKGVL